MRYLLDIHTLIWFINGDKKLSEEARLTIESEDAVNYVSIASLWQIAILANEGKLSLFASYEKIFELLYENCIHILPLSSEDMMVIAELPKHHQSRFDRMLVAQSMVNDLVLISKNRNFDYYDIRRVWQ